PSVSSRSLHDALPICRVRIERKGELPFPIELVAGIAERVVTVLCTRPMTGNVSSVSSDLVSNDAVLHVFLIRQAKVFFRRYVTEHRGTVPADHGCANRRSDVVVTGGDIGDQGPQRVDLGLVAHLF